MSGGQCPVAAEVATRKDTMANEDSTGRTRTGSGAAADRNRPPKSYVLRKGRLTAAQSRAIETLMPVFGLACEGEALDVARLFGRSAPLVVEIGFGNGEATWRMASAEPGKDFIGIEVHEPGVGHLLLALEEHGLRNVRIARCDAVAFIAQRLKPQSISEVRIFFPDPWPKKRHHKRRIIQPAFLQTLERALAPGGCIHIATDWPPYVEHIREVFAAADRFEQESDPAARPATKYERRGERLGHPITDMVFTLKEQGVAS